MCESCKSSPDCRDHRIKISINRTGVNKSARPNVWQAVEITAIQLAREIYKGFAFAPVFYENDRRKSSFKEAWHIALDFDCGDKRASYEELYKETIIDCYSSFAYYTPSNNPPAYKSRVVFLFDNPIKTVADYEAIQNAFSWWYPHSDKSTAEAARFFYGSKGAEPKQNWSILPLVSAKEIVKQWQEATHQELSKETSSRPVIPFGYHHNGDDIEEEDIREMLSHIPAWGHYDDWLRVCMAVHSVYPDYRGIRLIEEWSPGQPGEVTSKFNSFKRSDGGLVGIGSLITMAQNNGYKMKTEKKTRWYHNV